MLAWICDISLIGDDRGKSTGRQPSSRALQVTRDDGVTRANATVWRDNPASSGLRAGSEFGGAHTQSEMRLAPAKPGPDRVVRKPRKLAADRWLVATLR